MKKFNITLILFLISNLLLGQLTFQKTFDGLPGFWDYGYSVQQTTDGGFIIAGSAEDTLEGWNTYNKVYLIKVNSIGDTSWTRTYEDTTFYERASEVVQTIDGGYIMAVSKGNTNAYLIKTNTYGDTLWTRTYSGNTPAYINSISIKQTTDSGYIVASYYSATGSSGEDDGCLIKINAGGNIIWTKTYGGTFFERFYDVQQTTDGGYIAVGITYSFGIVYDAYLVKTDSTGDTLWTKSFGGNNQDWGLSVKQTSDGGYIVVGVCNATGTSSDVYLIKTNANGDTLWTKSFGGPGIVQYSGWSVEPTTDNGYIIAGQACFNGGCDAYLIKTNDNGDTLWTKTYGGGRFTSVHQTTEGGYIALGTGSSGLAVTGLDLYLVKTDSMGYSCNITNHPTIVSIPTTNVTNPATIVTTPFIGIGTTDCIIMSGGNVSTPCNGVDMNEVKQDHAISIYPNPVATILSIEIKKLNFRQLSLGIKNILGQTLLSEQENNIGRTYTKTIDLKFLSKGIYFLEVNVDGERTVKKIVKE